MKKFVIVYKGTSEEEEDILLFVMQFVHPNNILFCFAGNDLLSLYKYPTEDDNGCHKSGIIYFPFLPEHNTTLEIFTWPWKKGKVEKF